MLTSRRVAVLAGVLVVAAVVGAAWWYLWVPQERPALGQGEVYGIDISNHQGPIDWRRVPADDIDIAYIKSTEGRAWVDASYARNWRESGDAGLRRGAYHFFTLCAPGVAQAENFLRTAPPDPAALPPSVDLELRGNCSARPSREELYRELDAFLADVERAWGRKVLLYVGPEWEKEYPVYERGGRPLWLPRFGFPPYVDRWAMWQLHGRANVDGVQGGVDFNVVRPALLDVPAAGGVQ